MRNEFKDNLKQFTQAMDKGGPWFLGDELSMIDLIMAPWAVRLWVFEKWKGGLQISEDDEVDEGVWKRWRKWLAAVEDRQSVKETTSDEEHYLPLYERYARDEAQSEMAKSIRAGRGVV